MMFLDCPAYLDEDGTQRCGLPAEVSDRFTTGSTSGPIENVKICCPSGHRFHGPIEFLTMPADRGIEQATARAGQSEARYICR
jgi:hypothetical protein